MKKSLILLLTSIFIFASCSNGNNSSDNVVTYIGTKAPTVAKEVGDIVFNDGSAIPYTEFTGLDAATKDEKKTAAIALIFYKGTGLNSDAVGGTPDTTTIRTLGVGLKHNRNGIAWCLDSAAAYSNNIQTIQCPSSEISGALTFTGDKNGSDNLEQIEAFEEVDDTGTDANYPAFYFAKNYKGEKLGSESSSRIPAGSEFENGWYLPSIAELFQIYSCSADSTNGFNIDAASEALGGNKFKESWYISSSQCVEDNGHAYVISKEGIGAYFKYSSYYYVCAIRAFN